MEENKELYFTEIVSGNGVDLKSTALYNLVKYGKTDWQLDLLPLTNQLVLWRAILNVMFGKTGKINELCDLLKEKRASHVALPVFDVLGCNVKVKGVRYFNSLNQLHIYTSINNVESSFLRFYVLEGKLYWLLNKEKWIRQHKIQKIVDASVDVNVVDSYIADLKACDKVGDASRFVDDPKKEHFPNSIEGYKPNVNKIAGSGKDHYLGHRFVCIKGGLVCKDYFTYKDALKYARRYKCDVYYTGDIPIDVMIACQGNLTLNMFLAIKPMFKYGEEGGDE